MRGPGVFCNGLSCASRGRTGGGAGRSLAARIVRDDEVGGSNPLAPTFGDSGLVAAVDIGARSVAQALVVGTAAKTLSLRGREVTAAGDACEKGAPGDLSPRPLQVARALDRPGLSRRQGQTDPLVVSPAGEVTSAAAYAAATRRGRWTPGVVVRLDPPATPGRFTMHGVWRDRCAAAGQGDRVRARICGIDCGQDRSPPARGSQ